MNKFGKSIVKTLLLGGAVVTGVALNSSNSMAAELETVEPEPQVADAMDASEQTDHEKVLQSMEDAVEVIEGDAVAEEGYLNQGLDAIEYNDLPYEKGQEIMNAGGEVMGQAFEKWDYVQYTHEDLVNEIEPEAEAAIEEFVEVAKEQGYEESAKGLETAETNQEKLNIVNEIAEQAEEKYDEENYNDQIALRDNAIEIYICEYELEELQNDLKNIKDELDELENEKINASKDLYRFKTEVVEPYQQRVADIERRLEEARKEEQRLIEDCNQKESAYNQLRGELNGIMAALDEANWALNNYLAEHEAEDLYDDKDEYEALINRLNSATQHFTERSEDFAKLPQLANDFKTAEGRLFGFADVTYGLEVELDFAQSDYDEAGGDEALETLTRIANEVNEKYDKTEAKYYEIQNAVDKKQSYIKSLEEKNEKLDQIIQYREEQYSVFYDATEKYRAILNELVYADALYNRGYTAFSKTSDSFMTLINSISEFWQSEQETDGEAVLEKMKNAERELIVDTAIIGMNADVIKQVPEDHSATILTVDNKKTDSDSRIEAAKKNNEKIHKYYDQIKRALEQAEKARDEFLEDPGDWETTFVELDTKYQTLVEQERKARELVKQADLELEQAVNNYGEVTIAYEDFYKDVTYINEYREFWDHGYRIVASFVGYIKSDDSSISEIVSIQDVFDHVWGYLGTVVGDVYDENGNKVDHFEQDINMRFC